MAISAGMIVPDDVRNEWRAQIERCLENGIQVRFLNSHEHMHILPSLFRVISDLAKEYGIAHLRFPNAVFDTMESLSSVFRIAVVKTFARVNRRHIRVPAADFIGLETSGKLDLAFIRRRILTFKPGRVYELMCHPGYFDEREVSDPRLSRYHDWKGELDTLTNPALMQLLNAHGVQLVGYRHLEIAGGGLVARR
jgi:predicted glycoside hydrolase/deacetylase ChbG (UPF0249 family)